jgi:hypothetical protein
MSKKIEGELHCCAGSRGLELPLPPHCLHLWLCYATFFWHVVTMEEALCMDEPTRWSWHLVVIVMFCWRSCWAGHHGSAPWRWPKKLIRVVVYYGRRGKPPCSFIEVTRVRWSPTADAVRPSHAVFHGGDCEATSERFRFGGSTPLHGKWCL